MRILAVGFFALVYLVALLIMAPASLFDELVRHYSQGRLVMANANGTMWKGTAVPALRTRDGHLIATRTLRWDIDFLPLLKGMLRARLQWNDSAPAAATELLVSGGQVELNHALIPLPAALLNEVSPILKPAEFRGQLEIQSNHLVLSRRGMEGIAIVDWQHAGSTLSSIDPLGNYRLTLNGAGNVVSVDLSTTSGILVLEGQGKWSGSSGLEFRGKARASSGNEERLNELLHNLGPELSPGVATFNLTPGQ
ncbi:MAG: type II secretion system protein N [Gallionellaceae bacterium]